MPELKEYMQVILLAAEHARIDAISIASMERPSVLARAFDDLKPGVLGFSKTEVVADEAFATASKRGTVLLGCHDS